MTVITIERLNSPKKIWTVTIISLIVGLAITGVSLPGHSNPGILRVPEAYPTIQAAITAASPGDTVLVSSGIYKEPLTIGKSLNLTGLARDTTVIDTQENGPGINITRTSGVFVSGFTIRGTGFFYDAIDVFSSTGVTVTGNKISASNQSLGVFILNSSSVTVRNNLVSGSDAGVNLQGGFGNILQGNNVTLNNIAIGIVDSEGNEVKDNWLGLGRSGLQLLQSQGNVVARNRIFNNTGNGAFLWNSTANKFLENDIAFAMGQSSSIGIRFQNSTGNQLYYNNIRNNTIQVFGVLTTDISLNTWNDGGTSPMGNFWSDYAGLDDGSSGRVAGDGVGDTAIPHPCPSGGRPCSTSGPAGVDNYPLMTPWTPPPLTVAVSANRMNGYAPLNVTFTGTVSGGAAPYSYLWDFGTGSISSLLNVSYTYQAPGSYVAKLRVTDDTQAQRTDLVPITVLALPPPAPKPADILPTVLIAIGLVLLTVVVAVIFLVRRKKTRSKPGSAGPVKLGL